MRNSFAALTGFPVIPNPETDFVTHRERKTASRLLLIVATLALFATACSGGTVADPAVVEEAEANQAEIVTSGDISQTEMLDVSSGEITSLSEVVTGDRAVLVWYWAPH